jgi:3-oxoacyl-[acyl-carrier protein] reductase
MGILTGKVALITGGSRGIGESIVRMFAAEGAHVAFTYLSSESKALELASEASASGVKVIALKSDASDYTQAEKLGERCGGSIW